MPIAITHPKVDSLAPTWAPFAGVSLIFDRFGAEGVGDDARALHRTLDAGLGDGSAWAATGFCPLPPHSYHVTLVDLINTGNVWRIARSARGAFLDGEGRLAPVIDIARALAPTIARSGVLDVDIGDLAFTLALVADRAGKVVVAELEPATDLASMAAWRRLIDARDALSAMLDLAYGITCPAYAPHVSLGYFANRERAPDAAPLIAALNDRLRGVGGAFRYGRPAMFGFADMARFSPIT